MPMLCPTVNRCIGTPDLYTYTGSRPPGYAFPSPRGPHVQGYNLRQPFSGPPPGVGAYQLPPGVYYTSQPAPTWISSGPYPDVPPGVPPHIAQQMVPQTVVIYPKTTESGAEVVKATVSVAKKTTGTDSDISSHSKVSVGVQNDGGGSSRKTSNKKAKTKTIILMDTGVQTDFADEIANLTLAEKPNALFKNSKSNKRHRRRNPAVHAGALTSTDSEEIDSDSGYSSPLHRRNQTSNGTHPVGPSGLVCSDIRRLSGSFSLAPGTLSNLNSVYGTPMFATVPQFARSFDSAPGSLSSQDYRTVTPEPASALEPASSIHSSLGYSTTSAMDVSSRIVGRVPTETLSEPAPETSAQDGDALATGTKRKRRRTRRRGRRKTGGTDVDALSDSQPLDDRNSLSRASSENRLSGDGDLHFEDDDEFPDLQTSASVSKITAYPNRTFTYSDILKQTPTSPVPLSQELHIISQESNTDMFASQDSYKFTAHFPVSPGNSLPDKNVVPGKDKNARKRKKRQDQANKAAEEEMAEISIEQQMLKEMGNQKVKSKQPVALNLALMIDALEKQQEEKSDKPEKSEKVRQHSGGALDSSRAALNPLDSSGVTVKRGKERECPKSKRPSSMKKVILKEREEKKKLRLLEDGTEVYEVVRSPELECDSDVVTEPEDEFDEQMMENSDLSQDAMSSKASISSSIEMSVSADLSPISQNSPIAMSPVSVSPMSSGLNSPISGLGIGGGGYLRRDVSLKIHSRRFREYCNQILDKDIDNCCTQLLQELVRFQDRLFHKDPIKAKAKRRIVLGLREVTKHLKLKKIKCVVISPNLERIQSKGGLDEALNNIMYLCSEQNVPFVFALGRRALGRACAKLVPVSVAGIFNYDGAEEHFNRLMDLTVRARQAYKDMVSLLEKECQEHAENMRLTNGSALFAHMGHSRTPSASSAISFSSSILSEPISENYPHSEPETDAKGNEVKAKLESLSKSLLSEEHVAGNESAAGGVDGNSGDASWAPEGAGSDISVDSRENSPDKGAFMHDIDEGHEADTEEIDDAPVKNKIEDTSAKDKVMKFIETGVGDASMPDDLPHIDSIHSSTIDISSEILSQHSSKTAEHSADVMSTHSSKTLGELSTVAESAVKQTLEDVVSGVNGLSVNSQRVKSVNKERVESWVAEAATVMEGLKISQETNFKGHTRAASK